MPHPSPPRGRRSASRRRADRACRPQCSSRFQRSIRSQGHLCSCLTRSRRGKQSGLVTLTFDLLTLKVVSESHVTWATSVLISIFLGHSVLDLSPMYATDRRQTASSLNAPPIRGGGIKTVADQNCVWERVPDRRCWAAGDEYIAERSGGGGYKGRDQETASS